MRIDALDVSLVIGILAVGSLAGFINVSFNRAAQADLALSIDRSATQWLDTSDARQCYDYQGMKNGRMVIGCKDGKSYQVEPAVVERAEQMRKAGEGR